MRTQSCVTPGWLPCWFYFPTAAQTTRPKGGVLLASALCNVKAGSTQSVARIVVQRLPHAANSVRACVLGELKAGSVNISTQPDDQEMGRS